MQAMRRRPVRCCPLCSEAEREPWLSARGFSLVYCRACGHRYATEVFDLDALANAYYNESDAAISGRASAYKRRRFGEYQALLGSRFGKPGRVLEFGCNAGATLRLFKDAGWAVAGVEMSPGPARYAQRALGPTIHHGRVEDAPIEAGAYDLVLMSHLLEHLADPVAGLRAAARALRAGGAVLVEVPNADDALVERWAGDYRPLCPGDHLSFFDAARLERALDAAGLLLVSLRSPTHADDIVYSQALSGVDRWRNRSQGPAAPADGVQGAVRLRGMGRRFVKTALDRALAAVDPLVVRATQARQRAHRGPVLIAVAEPAPRS